jgi:hypothetical protein
MVGKLWKGLCIHYNRGHWFFFLAIKFSYDRTCSSYLCRQKESSKVLACSDLSAVDKNIINASQSTKNATTTIAPINTTPAKIQLLFSRVDHTGGYIFTTHYVVWGKVSNTGGTVSEPISVQIAWTNTKRRTFVHYDRSTKA